MENGHRMFEVAEGTIDFARLIDKLFDLLNIKRARGKGFQQAIRLSNKLLWQNTIFASINYLLSFVKNTQMVVNVGGHFCQLCQICYTETALCSKNLTNGYGVEGT